MVVKASKLYTLIGRTMDSTNIHYGNVLSSFKIEWDIYEELKNEYDPNVLVINDKEKYTKVIGCILLLTVSIKHMDQEDLSFMYYGNQSMLQVRWMIH